MENLRKKSIVLLKIVVSAALLYFIFTKLNFAEVYETIKKANPWFLVLAILLFVFSKITAAFRLNLYFHKLDILLSQRSNLKLYVLGMFYNLFLPGGIGGDAYKGYLIKKKFKINTKKVVAVLVLDRLSGLLLLFLYACIIFLFISNATTSSYQIIAIILTPLSVVTFWYLNKKFFNYVLAIFWKSFGLSALVQLAQLICVFCIMKALSIHEDIASYLFVFLVSSIVSVIPLTIGGIGSRELTFFYGASLLSLDENISIGISMLFFLITALVSVFGIVYHFKKVDLKVRLES